MPHPALDNNTAFHVEPLVVQDEHGNAVCGAIAKSTLGIGAGGALERVDAEPVDFAGVQLGDDAAPWYRYEPETAFFKPATDVVLIAHAYAPSGNSTTVDVGLRCGSVAMRARVTGDRYWERRNAQVVASPPQPFERMPLTWARAFGGWDRSDEDPARHAFESRNPAGVGFGKPLRKNGQRLRVPNVEHPDDPMTAYGQVVTPVGFGFVAPSWSPRASLAGTYDAAWESSRKPLLPLDFDRRFFNAAPAELVAEPYLIGNERVDVINASPAPRLSFNLPGFGAPTIAFEMIDGSRQEVAAPLDTVIIDTDDMKLTLLWRAHVVARNGVTDLAAIAVHCDHPAAQRRHVA